MSTFRLISYFSTFPDRIDREGVLMDFQWARGVKNENLLCWKRRVPYSGSGTKET